MCSWYNDKFVIYLHSSVNAFSMKADTDVSDGFSNTTFNDINHRIQLEIQT